MLSGVEWDIKLYHTAERWVLHCTWGYTYSNEGVWPLSTPHFFSTAKLPYRGTQMWIIFLPSLPVYSNVSNVDKTWSRRPLSDQDSTCQDVTRVHNSCQLRAITARETLALWILIAELDS